MPVTRLIRWLPIVLLIACGDDASGPGVPAVAIVSGDGQSAYPLLELRLPLVVEARGDDGRLLPNRQLTWRVSDGGGTLMHVGPTDTPANSLVTLTDARGRASVRWQLGTAGDMQTVLVGLDSAHETRFTAGVGREPLVLRYDGNRVFTELDSDAFPIGSNVAAIWGTSSSTLFVVGRWKESFTSGDLLFSGFDGTAWRSLATEPGCCRRYATAVWGRSATDVFAATYEGLSHGSPRTLVILRFDGERWVHFANPVGFGNPDSELFWRMWVDSSGEMFLAGSDGSVLRFNGAAWSKMDARAGLVFLFGIWGASRTQVYAVGQRGIIRHFDGSSWEGQSSGTTEALLAIHGSAGDNVFAVGANGTIVRFDGTAWSPTPSGTTSDLTAIWVISPTLAFAAGRAGVFLEYDGSQWKRLPLHAALDVSGVWASSRNEVLLTVGPGLNTVP